MSVAVEVSPAALPADVCGFCERLYRFCECDQRGYLLTDAGRIAALDAPDPLRSKMRAQYEWSEKRGDTLVCAILRDLLPELADSETYCEHCARRE